MVETQLRRRGIRDERVLRAMQEIPREEFLPAELRVLAYRDDPAHIGYGQTISQPYMTALMAEVLELTGTETVLEVRVDEPLNDAARRMADHDATHAVVVDDRSGRPVGVLSTLDIAGILGWGRA